MPLKNILVRPVQSLLSHPFRIFLFLKSSISSSTYETIIFTGHLVFTSVTKINLDGGSTWYRLVLILKRYPK